MVSVYSPKFCSRPSARGKQHLEEQLAQTGRHRNEGNTQQGCGGLGIYPAGLGPPGNRIGVDDAKDVPGRAQDEGPALGQGRDVLPTPWEQEGQQGDEFWGDGADLTPQE